MLILEQEILIPVCSGSDLIDYLGRAVREAIGPDAIPIRFVVTATNDQHYRCEVAVISGADCADAQARKSVFRFVKRPFETTDTFNVVLCVPTGIGAEIGGHAGDVTPVAQLFGQICDRVVLHPNVVNASDVNEMPANALYVEGSVLTRLLMGTVGLQPVRSNRVLVAIDQHEDVLFSNAAINAVSGARATYGLHCAGVVFLEPRIRMRARYTSSGRAAGRVDRLESLVRALDDHRGEYDCVAVSSVIDVPKDYHQGYFDAAGEMVNPWGGVEAMLTHALSCLYEVPTAHSPMFESREIADMDPGVVDPRMAAEAVSTTFLQCILKGLGRSPRIITDSKLFDRAEVVSAVNVSCLVIPAGCVGLPTIAALEQGINVIAVRENRNAMRNDLASLPWSPGQFHEVENYWEAAGVLAALRAGIDPLCVRRPLFPTRVASPMRQRVQPRPRAE